MFLRSSKNGLQTCPKHAYVRSKYTWNMLEARPQIPLSVIMFAPNTIVFCMSVRAVRLLLWHRYITVALSLNSNKHSCINRRQTGSTGTHGHPQHKPIIGRDSLCGGTKRTSGTCSKPLPGSLYAKHGNGFLKVPGGEMYFVLRERIERRFTYFLTPTFK